MLKHCLSDFLSSCRSEEAVLACRGRSLPLQVSLLVSQLVGLVLVTVVVSSSAPTPPTQSTLKTQLTRLCQTSTRLSPGMPSLLSRCMRLGSMSSSTWKRRSTSQVSAWASGCFKRRWLLTLDAPSRTNTQIVEETEVVWRRPRTHRSWTCRQNHPGRQFFFLVPTSPQRRLLRDGLS